MGVIHGTMKTNTQVTVALTAWMVTGLVTSVWAESPKMKMTTPIPAEIIVPVVQNKLAGLFK